MWHHLQTSDIREDYSTWRCYETGSLSFVFDVIIFSYLSLLQLVGIILAFQTRKVKINVLNDSKSVATLIYISSIVLVVIVLIRFFLRSYINAGTAIFCGGILLLATIFLVLIFCPKVIYTYLHIALCTIWIVYLCWVILNRLTDMIYLFVSLHSAFFTLSSFFSSVSLSVCLPLSVSLSVCMPATLPLIAFETSNTYICRIGPVMMAWNCFSYIWSCASIQHLVVWTEGNVKSAWPAPCLSL